MRSRFGLSLAGLLMVLGALPAAAGEVYSVFYDNRFGAIDTSTGSFTEIGTLPLAQSGGIAYDDGVLYTQDLQGNLMDINPVSGAASILGSAGLNITSAGFAGGDNGLYEVDYMSNLYTINPTTGAASLVGATGLAPNYGYWDTSLSEDGTYLYFTAGGAGATDELYRINIATGLATDLGSTGVSGIAGSAIVDGELELFQYHWSGATDYIYSAPLGSTDFTAMSVLDAQVVDGGTVMGTPLGFAADIQTSSVPEPFSLLLMGSGLIALALLGRRRNAPERMKREKSRDFPDVNGQGIGSNGSVSC